MMDNDRDGLLNESDLASIYDQIGKDEASSLQCCLIAIPFIYLNCFI